MCQTAWRSQYISLTAMQQHQVERDFRAAVLVVPLVVISQTALLSFLSLVSAAIVVATAVQLWLPATAAY